MSSWDDVADGWDDDPMVRAYAAAAYRSLIELLGGTAAVVGIDVLDFGCGTGLLTERLVDDGAARVVAVDTAPRMLEVIETKARTRGWTSVHTASRVPEGPFDLIVASSVLGFVDDHTATVADLVSRLRPDGRIVHWDWEDTGDGHGLAAADIRAALDRAGLVDIDVRTAFREPAGDGEMAPLLGTGRRPGPDAP